MDFQVPMRDAFDVRRLGLSTLPLVFWVGCAGGTTVVRNEHGGLVVEGPLAGPYATPDDVVDALPLILQQPGATDGDHGIEYCALVYRRPGEVGWYLSNLSSVVNTRLQINGKKSCEQVDEVRDPAARTVRIRRTSQLVVGDAHGHPWLRDTRGFSPEDLQNRSQQRWRITLESPEGERRVTRLRLLILADGRRYKYELLSGVVYKWVDGRSWLPICDVVNDQGTCAMRKDMSW